MTETKAKCMNFGGCLKIIYRDPKHHCICDNARVLTKHLREAPSSPTEQPQPPEGLTIFI